MLNKQVELPSNLRKDDKLMFKQNTLPTY